MTTSTPRWHQWLLPGDLRDDPDGRRTARDWIVDALMYAGAAAIAVAVISESEDQHTEGLWVADIALGAVAFVALWWRRQHPGRVGVIAGLASIVSGFAAGPAVIAAFNVALRGTRREIAVVATVGIAAALLYPLVYPPPDGFWLNLWFGLLLTAVVFGWGLFARVRREQVLQLRERTAQLEAEHRLRIEQAREAERRAIAREMHDVLAHRVSLLSLHAGALEFRPDAPPEEVAEAAGVIRANAHAALEELRAVIGVLRDGEASEGPEPPQPTLADVPALVDESRAAGLRVGCRVDVPDDVPVALGRTAYRIVQEGLTNARKHAPGAAVTLTVVAPDGDLQVEISSLAPVAVPAASQLPGAGTGLIGLAERVTLAGGELESGVDPTGAFVLRARLPR
jgi:signal transduction histidine kinase